MLTGACFGLGVLFHPQALLLAAAAGLFMLCALLATPNLTARRRSGGARLSLGSAFATCAWWLVLYMAKRDFSWLPEVGPPGWIGCGTSSSRGACCAVQGCGSGRVLSACSGWPEPRSLRSVLALVVPAFAIVFTGEALDLLHLRHPHGMVDSLQLSRMYYLMRPLALVMAAYALATPMSRALAGIGGRRGGWSAWLNRAVVAGLVALLIQLPGIKFPECPTSRGRSGFSRRRCSSSTWR